MWTNQGGGIAYTQKWAMAAVNAFPLGVVNLATYVPAGTKLVEVGGCGASISVDGNNTIAYTGTAASCGRALLTPSPHTFSVTGGWWTVTGYWK